MPPPRTEPYPPDLRQGYFGGTDQTTALGIYGAGLELALLAGQVEFQLGREGDLKADYKYHSAIHARFERHGNWLWVENVAADRKNPIFFRHHEQDNFNIQPGDTFRIGDTVYIALNDEMRLARRTMAEILGLKNHTAVDDCMIVAAAEPDRHIVLIGEPGSDHARLGDAIHRCSPRRRHRCVPAPIMDRKGALSLQEVKDARNGTLLIPLVTKWKVDPQYVSAALAPENNVRLIICVHAPGKVRRSFPTVTNAEEFRIMPLSKRKDEIPTLLDRWFIEGRSDLRFALLKQEIQDKLRAHRWKKNLQDLSEAAEHLMVLTQYESERAAERDKGTTRGASRAWRERLELPLPLVPEASTSNAGSRPRKKAKR